MDLVESNMSVKQEGTFGLVSSRWRTNRTWWPRCGDAGVGPGLTAFSREIELAAGTDLWISAEMSAFASAGLYNPAADSLNGGFAST